MSRRTIPGRLAACMAVGVISLLARAEPGAADAAPSAGERSAPVISSSSQWFELPTGQKSQVYRIHLEGRVSYVDRRWRHLWIDQSGLGEYFLLSTNPPELQQGQHVVIDGTVVPAQGLDARTLSVRVLRDDVPAAAIPATDRIGDTDALTNRLVTCEGYVDSQQLLDDNHLRLQLIIDDQPVTAFVRPADPLSVPEWRGCFVRITGLYQGRFDLSHTQLNVELWTARQDDVVVVGSIAAGGTFDIPVRPIGEVYRVPRGGRTRIHGRVVAADPGSSITIRDQTGQITIRSLQRQRIPVGAEVEVVGRAEMRNAEWSLHSTLVRVLRSLAPEDEPARADGTLETIEQIRRLTLEEAAQGRRVEVKGVVIWSLPWQSFFFLEDITGGIRVRYQPGKKPTPPRNKYLAVRGVTYNSGFAPAIELQDYTDLGAMSTPPVRLISYERALTGEEDGEMVDLRGFYRDTELDGDMQRIFVTTAAGEFVGLLRSQVRFATTPGSLVRLRGACEVVGDEIGRPSGVTLRLPSLASITIEEPAPANGYDLPLRSVKHLRRLSTTRELTRVRVSGVVLHAVPGRSVHIEDDRAGLLLLSHDTTPLVPGDRIEAVGILGWEGSRTIVREAIYRKIGQAAAPTPVTLLNPDRPSVLLDTRLVRVRGTLIDVLRAPDHLRLTLQSGASLFDAGLDTTTTDTPLLPPAVGAGLELTGIYRVGTADARQSRTFELQLRSPDDIVVYQRARFWTTRRALTLTGLLGGFTLLGFGWVTLLRRRVRKQTAQIRAQLERQAQLEAEVQHATRLESLGVLAGGIAHDFNNLLTIILGNLGLAMLDERAMVAVGESLRECERGAIRARDLTQQLLTFAKGGDPLRSSVALPDIIRETAGFVLRGSSARCEYDLPDDLWNANADRAQVAQMIQNLVLNALQSMPNGGVIRIAVRNEELAADTHPPLDSGRYLRLSIVDTGCGIDPEIVARIFDPYFSTKKTGSGLGLATVYSIVRRHHGHIQVHSKPGTGTTFTLWLPAAAADAPADPAAPARDHRPLPAPGRHARVLFMDDEESIRRLGTAVLERMRLDATVVTHGEEAVQAFRAAHEAGQPFDLVILDLTIPGAMGGRDAIERIRAVDPQVPAIVSSGYSNDPVLADFRAHGFQAIVPKPYDVGELGRTIDRLLARR